ncbi:MAG TPA: hypothetical protein VGI77_08355 [Gaiellaceae bacterium]|jgi:predicted ATP-grasp superfamily ATP-dependent carboligase
MITTTPVVVLYRGNQGAYGIARSLGPLGVPLYLVAQTDSPTPLSASRWWREKHPWDFTQPESETLASLTELGATLLARHDAKPVLLTATDWAAIFIESHADELGRNFVFPRADVPVVRPLADKWAMHLAARTAAVPTPETVFPQSLDDVSAFLESTRFPIVAKAADAYATHKPTSMIAANRAELLDKVERESTLGPPNLILQELIPGGVEDVWMCNAYFDTNGGCRAVFTGRKLRQLSSTGIATLAICEPNDAVASQTQRLLESVGYRGCVGVGHRFDARDGQYKLLDVNARVSGVFRLFRASTGSDVVRICYRDLTGQGAGELGDAPLDVGRKWLLEDDILVSIPRIRRGELSFRAWLGSLRGVREAQWLSSRDPLPFLAWLRRSVAAAIAKRRPPSRSARLPGQAP